MLNVVTCGTNFRPASTHRLTYLMQDSAGQKPEEKQMPSRPSWKEVKTRSAVENQRILQLAGMEEYAADQVCTRLLLAVCAHVLTLLKLTWIACWVCSAANLEGHLGTCPPFHFKICQIQCMVRVHQALGGTNAVIISGDIMKSRLLLLAGRWTR